MSEATSDETGLPRQEPEGAGRDLLAQALARENMQRAWKRVKANKGAAGVDGLDIARTGEEAIRKFQQLCYDIAFMDIKLPGKNGVESLTEIRNVCPSARVVMMTGFSEASLLDKARQAGAIDILCKPFRLKEMFSFIDQLEASPPNKSKH